MHMHIYIYTYLYRYISTYIYIYSYIYVHIPPCMAPSHLLPCPERALLAQATSAAQHSNHCLLCQAVEWLLLETTDMSAVTQQTYLLCHATDMPAVSHSDSKHVCFVTQPKYLQCDAADMPAV